MRNYEELLNCETVADWSPEELINVINARIANALVYKDFYAKQAVRDDIIKYQTQIEQAIAANAANEFAALCAEATPLRHKNEDGKYINE